MKREGGKKKPLKTPKKTTREQDEADLEFQQKERERKNQENQLRDLLLKKKKK